MRLIAAIGTDGLIGRGFRTFNHVSYGIPWHYPQDLELFRKKTMSCDVIMGRKTYESLTDGALKGRRNIVLTRDVDKQYGDVVAHDKDSALACASPYAWVIGGAKIYKLFEPEITEMHITWVPHSAEELGPYSSPVFYTPSGEWREDREQFLEGGLSHTVYRRY